MFILNSIKERKIENYYISICLADILVGGLLITFLYFYVGLFNVIDDSILLTYFLFYFFIRTCCNEKSIGALINIAPIVILLHILLCALQYLSILPNYNSYFDIGSTFGNPDMLSAYLSVLLPFCYMNSKWKVIRIIIITLTIFLFFFLQARTAIVATMVTMLFYYICMRRISIIYILIGVVAAITGTLLLIYWHEVSVLGRLYIWIVALSMMVSKPFGWGAYAFEKHYPEYQSQFTIEHPEIANALNYDIVHSPYNEFLNIGVTIGIVGLIFYLLFVCYVLVTAYKTKSLLLFPLLTFQIISLSYFPFRVIPLAVIYVICCAIVINTSCKVCKTHIFFSLFKVKVLSLCIIIPVLICFTVNLFSFCYWEKAISQAGKSETYGKSYESFQKSYPFLKNNGRFLISFAELKYNMNDNDMALSLMEQADNFFADISFLHNLAILYEQTGEIDKAKRKFEIAVNMSPNNVDIRYAQIQFLLRIGDIDKAGQLALLLREGIVKRLHKNDNDMILKKLDEMIILYKFPLFIKGK